MRSWGDAAAELWCITWMGMSVYSDISYIHFGITIVFQVHRFYEKSG